MIYGSRGALLAAALWAKCLRLHAIKCLIGKICMSTSAAQTAAGWFLVAELSFSFGAMNVRRRSHNGERERDMHTAAPLDHRSLTVVLMSAELWSSCCFMPNFNEVLTCNGASMEFYPPHVQRWIYQFTVCFHPTTHKLSGPWLVQSVTWTPLHTHRHTPLSTQITCGGRNDSWSHPPYPVWTLLCLWSVTHWQLNYSSFTFEEFSSGPCWLAAYCNVIMSCSHVLTYVGIYQYNRRDLQLGQVPDSGSVRFSSQCRKTFDLAFTSPRKFQ